MIKLAVFDLDGTLLDTVPDLKNSMNHALKTLGKPEITERQARAYIGNGIRKFAERALGDDATGELTDKTVAVFKEHYGKNLTVNTAVYPGIPEMLSALKSKGILLAVFSNKYDEAAKTVVEHYFPGVFDTVCGESEFCKKKPDPSGLIHILKTLDTAPEEAVMTGDSAPDHQVAVSVGVKPVSVLWGYRDRAALEAVGAKVFAENAEELQKILLSL